MQKQKVWNQMTSYLKSNHISYEQDVDNGCDRLTMVYKKGCENCPGGVIESCIWFYPTDFEARVYYSETASQRCKQSGNRDALMRLFNYISAEIWLRASDGSGGLLYKSSLLHTSRLYMTEDDCYDITLTTMVPYDFFDVAPLETEDYITAA